VSPMATPAFLEEQSPQPPGQSRTLLSPSPPGGCHPRPLAPAAAPQHPDHPRAHRGAAWGHPLLGQQGQVQQEARAGGERGDSGGMSVTPRGPRVATGPWRCHPASEGLCRGWWQWGHGGTSPGVETSPRAVPAPGGVSPLGLCAGRRVPRTPAGGKMAAAGVIGVTSWAPFSALTRPPAPGGDGRAAPRPALTLPTAPAAEDAGRLRVPRPARLGADHGRLAEGHRRQHRQAGEQAPAAPRPTVPPPMDGHRGGSHATPSPGHRPPRGGGCRERG